MAKNAPVIIQGSRRILLAGAIPITRESDPVLIQFGNDELLIEFAVDEEARTPLGTTLKQTFDANAIRSGEEKVRKLGSAEIAYSLTPIGKDEHYVEYDTPRVGPVTWLLSYKITELSERATKLRPWPTFVMPTPRASENDYRQPDWSADNVYRTRYAGGG